MCFCSSAYFALGRHGGRVIGIGSLKRDPVRLGSYLVAGVFFVGIAETLIFALKDGAYVLEGAVAVLMSLVLTFILQAVVAFGGCALVWKLGRDWVRWTPIDYVAAVVP